MKEKSTIMNLSDFIASTIEEVIEGTKKAQQYARQNGGLVVPAHEIHQAIKFDLTITTATHDGAKGRIGVVSWGVGIEGKIETEYHSTNRVQFSLPVSLPPQEEDKGGFMDYSSESFSGS